MAAYYGGLDWGSHAGHDTTGFTYDSMQATTNPYVDTYSVGVGQQALSGSAIRAQVDALRSQKREDDIQHYLERTKMGMTEGEMYPFPEFRSVSVRKMPDMCALEMVFHDEWTGRTYRIIVPDRQYFKVDQRLFDKMKYDVSLYDESKKWKMGMWETEKMETKKEYPTCSSCKERHKEEKLDLIGRCSVKLKSHNEKLRKLYWSHKNKIK